MEAFWISFLHIFFLCAAVCIDTFAAAFGFGIDQIRIPALSALVLSLVSSAALSLSMLAAGWLTPYLPAGLTGWLSCALLCGLGLLKLFDSAIKQPGTPPASTGQGTLLLFFADALSAAGLGRSCHSRHRLFQRSVRSRIRRAGPRPVQRRAGCRAGRRIFRPFPLGGVFCSAGMNLICILTGQPGRKKSSRPRLL